MREGGENTLKLNNFADRGPLEIKKISLERARRELLSY